MSMANTVMVTGISPEATQEEVRIFFHDVVGECSSVVMKPGPSGLTSTAIVQFLTPEAVLTAKKLDKASLLDRKIGVTEFSSGHGPSVPLRTVGMSAAVISGIKASQNTDVTALAGGTNIDAPMVDDVMEYRRLAQQRTVYISHLPPSVSTHTLSTHTLHTHMGTYTHTGVY
ncbi:hypothetical protein KIPB_011103 [Kipferlia bialata]|uniref:RRM domain-containing protein n=1 Tax=Kipferlia bialata TaxID=797122 RepID=A0A391NWW8_9EUKA|nr:hypothetical protein KIPB_011103 [Kipferlia bialata]|eukprot:g11103.t1